MSCSAFDLNKKIAVMIGGSRCAVAHGLAEAGANDVIAFSNIEKYVESVAEKSEHADKKTICAVSNVNDRVSLENLSTKSIEKFGGVEPVIDFTLNSSMNVHN